MRRSDIMGEEAHYHLHEYPDFMHTHYEVSWLGLGEEQARERYRNVVVLKLPPDNPDGDSIALLAGDGMTIYNDGTAPVRFPEVGD